MASYDLNLAETRVLGCLMEKERTTPENYPLSLNSLTAACNQSTNRDPVLSLDEKTVEEAIYSLRQKKLAVSVSSSGSRVVKYRHNLAEHYSFEPSESAILCVLLLRGAQTPGELRLRIERICGALTLEEVEARLSAMSAGPTPPVQVLPVRPGQKERRYIQLLSDPALVTESIESSPAGEVVVREDLPPSRLEVLSNEVTQLRAELAELRAEFASFRRQFE